MKVSVPTNEFDLLEDELEETVTEKQNMIN